MKKIFIPTYGGGHVKIVIPVIKELKKMNVQVTTLGLTASVIQLERAKLEYKKLRDYVDILDGIEKIISLGNQFVEFHYNAESGLKKDEIMLYLGINLYDLSVQFSEDYALKMFREEGRRIFNPLIAATKILTYEKPDVVMLTCGQRFEKAFGIVASQMGIPVVRVIDLLGEDDIISYDAKVCVMNEIVKKNISMANPNLTQSDIIVTGQPNIESEIVNEIYLTTKTKLRREEYKKCFLFLSQDTILSRIDVFKELIKIAKNQKDNLIIYRLHPNENLSYYDEVSRTMPVNMVIDTSYDLSSIIKISDVVITFFSTAALQAFAMGKSLITVNLTKEKYSTDFSKYEFSHEIKNLINLEDAILKLLDPESELSVRLKKARELTNIPLGASKNIANIIINL